MEDQLILFETAKAAKEKGFNEFSDGYYYPEAYNETILFDRVEDVNVTDWNIKKAGTQYCFAKFNETEGFYSASTQSLLQKWLREEHKLFVLVLYDGKSFYYQIQRFEWDDCITNFELYKEYTYEQALENGLLEGLKMI